MKRACVLPAVLALAVGGQVAYGHVIDSGTVVSYHCVTSPCEILSSVPDEGFVLTDILTNENNEITVKEDGVQKIVVKARNDGVTSRLSYHLVSGIPFAPGSSVEVSTVLGSAVTVSGYIPSSSGAVPAVGELGMAVMVALVLVVGAIVFTRMKQRQAAT